MQIILANSKNRIFRQFVNFWFFLKKNGNGPKIPWFWQFFSFLKILKPTDSKKKKINLILFYRFLDWHLILMTWFFSPQYKNSLCNFKNINFRKFGYFCNFLENSENCLQIWYILKVSFFTQYLRFLGSISI